MWLGFLVSIRRNGIERTDDEPTVWVGVKELVRDGL
jgi:hypothetical protein